ncbi:hypothetical protein V493_04559 [Pseudogymnoascus sp. VKM F-4281 (FW-2241)]|nr:hypothetical protein V493_04559 [Pseudogymnoascus sp. VKM F-4281 (FW-2241)]
MRYSLWIASALAPFALAAPKYDGWVPAQPLDSNLISTYFNQLAQKVGEGRRWGSAPVCDLSKAQMPVSTEPLPEVDAGTSLKHVALGRGIQNYTCDTTNTTAIPKAIGAVATLYNVSCIAATMPTVLHTLTGFSLQFDLGPNPNAPNPANLEVSGLHYFNDLGVPFFNLDTEKQQVGTLPCAKDADAPAPADAVKGQGNKGDGAVAWLKLTAVDGATGNLESVYRLNTAGGKPPATCDGMPATFEVEYAAEYWFFST